MAGADSPGQEAGSPGPEAGPVLMAAPVVVDGQAAGSLVAVSETDGPDGGPDGGPTCQERRQTLSAFAQQVSLALSDAQALEAIEEAYHDPLTGLPSRALFIQRLERVLESGAQATVLFIDLDRFKAVNDSLGHAAGDELLNAVAGRLRGRLRSEDQAARLGGDEFAVLVPDVPLAVVTAIAQRIIDVLGKPFRISGRDVLIGASVGIASGQAPDVGATELLGDADVAMYRAKKSGAGKIMVFEPSMQADALEQLSLSSDLQRALAGGELDLHYQPMVNLRTHRPTALEALVRWRHPCRGLVPPATFVPLAERSGLIVELGRWVLRRSLARAAGWSREHPDIAVSVNVSARQIVDPGFTADVELLLTSASIPPQMLILELTETALVTNLDAALSVVHDLKDLGTRLALDDFGTGYSSLSHLRRFPVDLLKIDGSFMRTMFSDPREETLVRAVLGLGRSLQIPTVAEGIETPAQLAMLRSNDCELGQGYLLGRPMGDQKLSDYLAGDSVVPLVG
jgi:diguanylate cyclase (GGDEF)-like protein